MFHSGIAVLEPVDYFVWYNAKQNRKASIFGACPWFDGSGEENWQKLACGYTLKVTHRDGSTTYGLGRKPFETFAEAVEFIDAYDKRKAA